MIEKRIGYNCLVSNATVGLELALRAKFRSGSRILIPSFTFKATYLAVKNAGLIPVSACVDASTWALNPQDIVDSQCDGAIIVAPFGHSIDFSNYDCLPTPIVYDLAGAWGLEYRGSNVAVYSFHATKNFSIGEGACITSSDFKIIKDIEALGNFTYTNAKLSEIQCALVCGTLESDIEFHSKAYETYGLKGSTLPHDYCSLLTYTFPPKTIYDVTTNRLFEARRYYYPLVEDQYRIETYTRTPIDHPTRSTISLPRNVTEDEQARILSTLRSLGAAP
jgi:hypothetical protein